MTVRSEVDQMVRNGVDTLGKSDVIWLRGKVVNKCIDENNEYCVEIETIGLTREVKKRYLVEQQ